MTEGNNDFELVLGTLKTGLSLEARGIKFYGDAAQKITDPKGRQTLRYLVHEEEDHLAFLNNIRRAYLDKNKASLKKTLEDHSRGKKEQVFPELEEFISDVKDTKGDKKILEEAMEIEKRTVKLYENVLDNAMDDEAKKVFEVLVEEEKGHLELVSEMHDYMVLHGVWSGLDDYFANE